MVDTICYIGALIIVAMMSINLFFDIPTWLYLIPLFLSALAVIIDYFKK